MGYYYDFSDVGIEKRSDRTEGLLISMKA